MLMWRRGLRRSGSQNCSYEQFSRSSNVRSRSVRIEADVPDDVFEYIFRELLRRIRACNDIRQDVADRARPVNAARDGVYQINRSFREMLGPQIHTQLVREKEPDPKSVV